MLSISFIASFSLTIIKVKGPEYATLEKPPNIAQFDPVSTRTIASKSPLLQARLNNMAKEHGPQAPVVNVVLPNNFGVYPDFGIAAGRAAGLAAAPSNQPHESTHLIPTNVSEGPKMDLETFCHIYALPDSIRSRLHEHKITGMQAFAHMTNDHLKEMEFKLGESIDLKEAIKCWAQGGD
jgi:hypothetical protein